MKGYLRFILLTLCFGPLLIQAQSERKEVLEQRKVRLMDEIELANRILEETQKYRANSLSSIETVQQRIRLRENLIKTLDREVELLVEQEQALQAEMDTLKKRIEAQKEAYAQMIRQAYKSRNQNSRLMFLLSAEDFNQALRRLEYLKQYSEYRRRQVEEIKENQEKLVEKAEDLRIKKVRKLALRGQLEQEKKRLSNERLSQEEAIAEYKSMEADLEQKLKEKQKEAKKVEQEIQRIIAEEIRRAKALARRQKLEQEAMDLDLTRGRDFTSNTSEERLKSLIAEARSKRSEAARPEEGPSYELTPEARQLSASFAANQRNLPWPVDRGLVVSKFGPQRHPVVKSVIIENKGIDIATQKGSTVKVIFDGEISSVVLMPDGYRAIIVNHGGYFTVYQNVTNLKVTGGQKVSKGQVLGEIAVNPVSNESRLHFEIWNNNDVMDPLGWLASK